MFRACRSTGWLDPAETAPERHPWSGILPERIAAGERVAAKAIPIWWNSTLFDSPEFEGIEPDRPTHSSASTSRLPRAAAAFSSWRRVGEWRGFSNRCAEGQDVSKERASSASDRSPRARRISKAA